MACKTENKFIGEREFSVTQWSAEKALLMKLRLIESLGGSISKLLPLADDKNKNKNEAEIISESVSLLFSNSSPEKITKLIKDSVVGVACEGRRITESSFNEVFSDDLMELYKVFFFVIEVNYKNFFKGLRVLDSLTQKLK